MANVKNLLRFYTKTAMLLIFIIGSNWGVSRAANTMDSDSFSDYRISPGDVIHVEILNHPEVSGNYTIGPDGKKTFPVAGVLKLAGLTREEAAERGRGRQKTSGQWLLIKEKDEAATDAFDPVVTWVGSVDEPGQGAIDTVPKPSFSKPQLATEIDRPWV